MMRLIFLLVVAAFALWHTAPQTPSWGATAFTLPCRAPSAWACAAASYGTGDGCHCGCGIWDPDCGLPYQEIVGCAKITRTYNALNPEATYPSFVCAIDGQCELPSNPPETSEQQRYRKLLPSTGNTAGSLAQECYGGRTGTDCLLPATPPAEWTCAASQYNSRDGCHCACGAFDPDCEQEGQAILGCPLGETCVGVDAEAPSCRACANSVVHGGYTNRSSNAASVGLTGNKPGYCGVSCEPPFSGDSCSSACHWQHCSAVRPQQVAACYHEMTMTRGDSHSLLTTLEVMLDHYAFTDISLQSPEPKFPLAVDLRQELANIHDHRTEDAGELHDQLATLFNSLQDAHTAYIKPLSYSSTYAIFPLFFVHFSFAGEHVVMVSDTVVPQLQAAIGMQVLTIDGQPVVDFFASYAETSVGISRDQGTRFNLAVEDWGLRSLSTAPLSSIPQEPVAIQLSNGTHTASIHLSFFIYSFQTASGPEQLATVDQPLSAESRKAFARATSSDILRERHVGVESFFGERASPLQRRTEQKKAAAKGLPGDLLSEFEQVGDQLTAVFGSEPSTLLDRMLAEAQRQKTEERRKKNNSRESTATANEEEEEETPSMVPLFETGDVNSYIFDNDTLVLKISTFSPKDYDLFGFAVVSSLLFAQDNDIPRLLIDLRDNGGGSICLGYAVTNYLFNGKFNPYGQYDFPAPPLAQKMATLSVIGADNPDQTLWSPYYWVDSKTGKNFENASWIVPAKSVSWNGRSSPVSARVHDDCSPFFAAWPSAKHHVDYSPNDVLILTHGFCGSTCANFAEHLLELSQVKSLTVGGLPDQPQSLSSFPGGQVYTLDYLLETLQFLNLTADPAAPQPFPVSARFSYTIREVYSWKKDYSTRPLEFLFEPSTFHAPYSLYSALDQASLYEQAVAYFPPHSDPNHPDEGSLSSVILIGVGVAVTVICIALGIYLYRRRQLQQERALDQQYSGLNQGDDYREDDESEI